MARGVDYATAMRAACARDFSRPESACPGGPRYSDHTWEDLMRREHEGWTYADELQDAYGDRYPRQLAALRKVDTYAERGILKSGGASASPLAPSVDGGACRLGDRLRDPRCRRVVEALGLEALRGLDRAMRAGQDEYERRR